MEKKTFKQLSLQEEQLKADMKSFIIVALGENNGRISLNIPQDTEQELDDDNYPVVSTLYGKHDNPQIKITDVYLNTQAGFFADGIDDDTGEKRKEFYIYPEQYSDIFYFIAHVLHLL